MDHASADAPLDPLDLAATARRAAAAGCEELLSWQGRFEAREKGPRDYVTDADLASQQAIERVLRAEYPGHLFVGEEEPAAVTDALAEDDRVCWVVDPLDGTTNYVHGFPCFAVSIAAVRRGWPVAGVICDPIREEVFWAAAGRGAWLGEKPLQTSRTKRLSDALVAISLPASVGAASPDLLDFIRVAPSCRAVRRIGSAALNLAYVACGRLDVYWAREVHAWDIAAGVLLVAEAGGVVTDATGEPLNIWRPPCVASSTPELHGDLRRRLDKPTEPAT